MFKFRAMKNLAAILLLALSITFARAQQKTIDSLQKELSTVNADTNRVLLLGELVKIYTLFKPDTALMLAQEAYNLSQQLHFAKGEALSLNRIATAYATVGDYPKALQFFTKALKICEDIGDQTGIGRSINNIGNLYLIQGDYKKALEYFMQAKNSQGINGDNYLKTVIFLNIGESYLHLNQSDSALYYLEAYYPVSKQNRQEDLYGDFERLLGDVKVLNDHTDEAFNYFDKSISSYEAVDDKQHLSMTYQSIAKLYQKINRPDSAIRYAKKSLVAAQLGSYNQGIFNASKLLSVFYEGKNDKEAFRYFKIATAAKDSLFSQDKVKQLLSLSFEEKQHQQDIETARANYLNQIKLYVLGGVLVVFLLLAIILFRNNRQKQKANTLLKEQKQEIQKTLTELKSTQTLLIQSEKMASLGELTAGIAHEIQNPLNFVNNFSEVNTELIDELKGERSKVKGERNEELEDEILNDVKQNLEKIIHHGKRADAIVKGMLQHSHISTGQKEPTDINALVDEYLRLSYHGMRAKDPRDSVNKSFNATLQTDFDTSIEKINVVPQDIGRVLLNLFNNAFYGVTEKKKHQKENYEPTVSVSTKKLNNKIEIRVKDNGIGIPEKVVDKIFQPFFTTKPTGQGTGLGLSLAYDIIKAHGGEIKVETKEGEGAEFIISLPLKT